MTIVLSWHDCLSIKVFPPRSPLTSRRGPWKFWLSAKTQSLIPDDRGGCCNHPPPSQTVVSRGRKRWSVRKRRNVDDAVRAVPPSRSTACCYCHRGYWWPGRRLVNRRCWMTPVYQDNRHCYRHCYPPAASYSVAILRERFETRPVVMWQLQIIQQIFIQNYGFRKTTFTIACVCWQIDKMIIMWVS